MPFDSAELFPPSHRPRALLEPQQPERALLARSADIAHKRLLHVVDSRGFERVERMNDCSTHAEVLAAFEAILAARRVTHLAA
jgi:hypothetical protein